MILVTGATGFIGSHLVDRLAGDGRAVRCLVRRTSAVAKLPSRGVEFAYGDLTTGDGVSQALHGVDIAIHLAGVTKARVSSDYYTGNVQGTANLLRAAPELRRLVHVSSLAAAGPSFDGKPLTEDDEPRPVSHYGRSKLAAEELVRKSMLSKRSVIVRPPVVYGPRDADVFQIIRGVARGWMVRIGSAERWFSLIYVKDLVSGLIAAADAGGADGVIYMAHPEPVTWEQFGSTAARSMGKLLRTATVPERAAYAIGLCGECWSRLSGRPGILSRDKVIEARCAGWVCDSSRARRELGFCAPTGLEEGLKRTLEWYREAGWLH